ncbi:hypothetical protein MGG_15059 [Pyricularia oryzae 70-15]|uniref:Uncharacterized protein n=3 Tax=Pyricularia oryzae TaxID=318829 RepID=G4MYR1_PYRO7|nr:uncharacterized protein MGG_15059 [Pyricularia oryzae 70-15]EHA55290.1 hypothetical protein MGG_15059 [Pyricularia oryzae 70-15]ELQ44261.1 hypothetical protein OOU_Y34scaffold00094g51 [Pyricularia oryzae Y34]
MAASKRATASAPRLASPPPQALLQHAAPVFLGGVRERVAGGDLAVRLRVWMGEQLISDWRNLGRGLRLRSSQRRK